MTSVDAPKIYAIADTVRVSNYLLVVGRVRSLELHVNLHLTEKEPTSIRCLGVSRRWDLPVEYAFQNRNFRPRHIVVGIYMHVFPSPVF